MLFYFSTCCQGRGATSLATPIKFTSKEEAEIVITGRTKHFLSLCGEHLSVDNMNKAVQLVANDLNIAIPEFTVAGIPHKMLHTIGIWALMMK